MPAGRPDFQHDARKVDQLPNHPMAYALFDRSTGKLTLDELEKMETWDVERL